MPPKEVFKEIEDEIKEVSKKPDPNKVPTLGDIGNEIAKKEFPTGPADSTAFLDYSYHVLGTHNIYTIPMTDLNIINGQLEFIEKTANTVVTKLAKSQKLANASFITKPKASNQTEAQYVSSFRNNLVGTRDFFRTRYEEYHPDIEALDDLAKKIDGLISGWGYEFDIFQPKTINLGLRLIYRQEWKPRNYQTGELIYTLPLTPGEKVKYETKTWQTTKTTQEINESMTYSTEEVLSATERDISEIINTTTIKHGYKVEAGGGFNIGVGSGNASLMRYADYQKESKDSKQRFREALSKTTQSIKNERKVSVNIASEVGSETRMTREISNPNNEITVTYLFYELQRVYEIREYLYDAIPIVYVANEVPPRDQIIEDWIIKYDWIIAGAILDKSFIEPLTFITNNLPGLEENFLIAQEVYVKAREMLDEIKAKLIQRTEELDNAVDKLKAANMINVINYIHTINEAKKDIKELEKRIEPVQTAFEKARDHLRTAQFEYEQGSKKVNRLLEHIRDNILHYMQAIWENEPFDQRYLRLRSILYPDIDIAGVSIDENGDLINPKFKIKRWLPIADVIDTNQLLGYIGNYSIYKLKRDDNALVNWMANNYLKDAENNNGKQVTDPDGTSDSNAKTIISTPTDAVYIEALPGTKPLLEHFKLLHRAIDLDKAKQELLKQQLENIRRLELIKKGDLGDPEIEKVIITDGKGLLKSAIAGISVESTNE